MSKTSGWGIKLIAIRNPLILLSADVAEHIRMDIQTDIGHE